MVTPQPYANSQSTWLNLYYDATDEEVYRITGFTVPGSQGASDAAITKEALATADYDANYNATHTFQWSDVLNLTPAGIGGVAQVFWNTLSPVGQKLSLRVGTGTAVPFVWEDGSFTENYTGGVFWLGDPDEADPVASQAGDVDTDTEEEIIALLGGNSAAAAAANDSDVIVVYYDATDTEVYKVTSFSPEVEADKGLRYVELAGGGGGGTVTTGVVLGEPEELWAGDLVAATADTFVFVTDENGDNITLPDDDDVAYVVIEHGSDDASEPPVGTTHWVPIAKFNALTAAAALTATNQVTTSDFFRATVSGGFTRRDFSWGLTAMRELVFTSDNAGEGITGGSISLVRKVEVVTDVSGGGGGGAGSPSVVLHQANVDAVTNRWNRC